VTEYTSPSFDSATTGGLEYHLYWLRKFGFATLPVGSATLPLGRASFATRLNCHLCCFVVLLGQSAIRIGSLALLFFHFSLCFLAIFSVTPLFVSRLCPSFRTATLFRHSSSPLILFSEIFKFFLSFIELYCSYYGIYNLLFKNQYFFPISIDFFY
jgi:hypothetical protein